MCKGPLPEKKYSPGTEFGRSDLRYLPVQADQWNIVVTVSSRLEKRMLLISESVTATSTSRFVLFSVSVEV